MTTTKLEIDSDLWSLTQQYVKDQLAIMKRAGVTVTLDQEALELLVQVTAEPGQAVREKAGFKYEPPTLRPDSV